MKMREMLRGKDALASVEPSVGTPNEAVDRLVPVADSPSVEPDATVSDGNGQREGRILGEGGLLVEAIIPVGVLENGQVGPAILRVAPPGPVVPVLHHPHPTPSSKQKAMPWPISGSAAKTFTSNPEGRVIFSTDSSGVR